MTKYEYKQINHYEIHMIFINRDLCSFIENHPMIARSWTIYAGAGAGAARERLRGNLLYLLCSPRCRQVM
jgi:hypothetical protein